jgi:hypothetical protein
MISFRSAFNHINLVRRLCFKIREFHYHILENGTLPLLQLRAHVVAWNQGYRAHH